MPKSPIFKKPFAPHFSVFLFFAFPLHTNCIPVLALFLNSDAR